MNSTNNLLRIYVKAVANGFVVELYDHNYDETVYVFTDWNEAVAWVQANQPVFKNPESAKLNAPSEATLANI